MSLPDRPQDPAGHRRHRRLPRPGTHSGRATPVPHRGRWRRPGRGTNGTGGRGGGGGGRQGV